MLLPPLLQGVNFDPVFGEENRLLGGVLLSREKLKLPLPDFCLDHSRPRRVVENKGKIGFIS